MQENHPRSRRLRRYLVIGAVLAFAAGANVIPAGADHSAPHVQPLTRNGFTTDVAVQFRVKLEDQRTLVRNVKDASDVVLAQITLAPGVVAGWHGHSGPAVLMITAGTLTSVLSDDCSAVDYPAGSALIDPGQGSLHWAVNNGTEDVVLYAMFFGVANGPVIPATPPPDCTP